jgi:protein-tyrosine phosphatase
MAPIRDFTTPACVSLLGLATLAAVARASDISLAGVANFRDIGGYSTADGRRIKPHTIFRSGELSGATREDQDALRSLHIRYEVDLRNEEERKSAPSAWGAEVPQVVAISIGDRRLTDSTAQRLKMLQTPEQARAMLKEATARIALSGAAGIGQVLRGFASGNQPALVHCTAGKDRTGVTVAVLMTLLNVARTDVYREYLLSGNSARQQLERAKARNARAAQPDSLSSLPQPVLNTLLGTEPAYLDAAFEAIDKQYGSFEAYTRDGLGLSAADVQKLRNALLEN